ncbi:hypothetical protein [Halorubrum sp. Ib24]|uniref:hypothetical protein n=1 Tax=Halorubrum sp. Ib24 TaxID=1383850 RepID=UPI003743789C
MLSRARWGARERRLVPTAVITAVDRPRSAVPFAARSAITRPVRPDRGPTATSTSATAFLGRSAPGRWEYEVVEMKSPGSIWNPTPGRASTSRRQARPRGPDRVTSRDGRRLPTRPGWASSNTSTTAATGEGRVLAARLRRLLGPVGVWQVRGRPSRNGVRRGSAGPPRRSARAVRGRRRQPPGCARVACAE